MAGFVAAVVTAVLAEATRQILGACAARSRARRVAGATVYRLTLAGRIVFDAAIVIMGGLACLVVYHGEDWRIAALLGGFVVLCVFAYPGDIVVDPASGIRTRRWYGPSIEIAWAEVAGLRDAELVGQSTVVSVTGRSIVHTSLHADGAGFRRDVRSYARLPGG